MNRSPFTSFKVPPSPRQPSVTRMLVGTIPVGWNCTASMFPRGTTPVFRARMAPAPSQITALVVSR